MSGGLRCFKETLPYTEKFLFSNLDYDLFFYGVENNEGKEKNIIDFKNLYNPKKFVINDINFYQIFLETFHYKNPNIKKNLVQLHYNIMMCNKLRKKYELENNIKYDVIIRCRPDGFFKTKIPDIDFENAINNNLVVPEDWSFGGISDIFAIMNDDVSNIYSSLYETIGEYFEQNLYSPEIIFQNHLKKHNVKIFFIEKYLENEFPDTLDINNITFNNADQRNFKYSYDKK
jgi:hypothetical protein